MSTASMPHGNPRNPRESDREFKFCEGIIFVGDTEVALAGESVLFRARGQSDRSLRLSIREADCDLFAEAWQRMIHSARWTATGYPLSGLVPTASAALKPSKGGQKQGQVQGQPGQVEPQPGQAIEEPCPTREEPVQTSPEIANIIYATGGGELPIYAGAVYAEVVYASVLYAQVAYVQGVMAAPASSLSSAVSALTTLSITGSGEDSRRRVLAVEGISSVDLAVSASRPELADLLIRFAPGLPSSGLVRLIQGI